MFITRFDPFKEFYQLESAGNKNGRVKKRIRSGFVPTVSTREGDEAYFVEIDLPGIEKEDINIDVHDNVLSVSGERKVASEYREEDYYKIESYYGKFERSFTLPEDVDGDNIEAESVDGVLEIKIPKVQQIDKAPRKIEIK